MKRIKIVDILKELQEGVDFTVESKKKVIFHNEKIVNYLMRQGGEEAKWFYESVKKLIPSVFCSYEENGRGSVFTFKSGNNKKDSNQEIEKNFKENTGIDITHHGKNSNGGHVISGKFKNPEIEKQKNELIEESISKRQVDKSKENLNRHFIDDGKGLTYSVENKDQNRIIKETYHQPRSEEEKKQIIERNKKRREEEKRQKEQKETSITAGQDKETESINLNELTKEINQKNTQTEISLNSDNKDQKSEKETSQISSFQNKDNNINRKVYWGIGLFSLLILVGAIVISKCKQKKDKKV